MYRIVIGTSFGLLLFNNAAMALCTSYPYTLTNGTTADATQVMANFNCAVLSSGATIDGATLNGATLNSATLSGATLSGATLSGVTTASGNLVVGSNSPRGHLTIYEDNGMDAMQSLFATTGSPLGLEFVYYATGLKTIASFQIYGAGVGTITANNYGTSYNTMSDKRVKTNFADLSPDIARSVLSAYHPEAYKLRGVPSFGAVAQDVYSRMSAVGIDASQIGLITKGDENNALKEGQPGFHIWQMDSSKMVPFVVSAQLDDERRAAALEQRVHDLEALVSKLQHAEAERPLHHTAKALSDFSTDSRKMRTALN